MLTVITEAGTNLPLEKAITSLEDFRDWVHSPACPERGRFTYVSGGFEIDMSPERISGHNDIKTQLTVVLGAEVKLRKLGVVFSDGVLLINDEADLGCEPDLMFCNWETIRCGRATYRAGKKDEDGDVELFGTPDMVAEIVSNSSVRKDKIDLRRAYFDAGITEYWLIDGRGEEIEFELLVRGATEFVATAPDADGFRMSPTFGRAYRFTREADPVGGIQCELLVRTE